MRIVLVSPPIEGADALAPTLASGEHLGLGYLAASLRSQQHDVRIINAQVQQLSCSDIVERIVEYNPDFVGLSPVSASIANTIWILESVKAAIPGVRAVLGGHLATMAAREIMEEIDAVDFILKGDSEETLVALVGGEEILNIAGAVWRGPLRQVCESAKNPNNVALDEIPLPDRDDLSHLKEKTGLRAARILASRGCQYNCSFCTTPEFYGRIPRFRDAEAVVREMLYLRENHGINHFWFNDDLFITGSHHNTKWLENFCRMLDEAKLRCTFRVLCRSDSFKKNNHHIIGMLIGVGLTHVFLGIESGSNEALIKYNKRTTVEHNLATINLLKDAGVKVQIGFIMFNPYSTLEQCIENAEFLAEIGELYRFFPLTRTLDVFPGTPIAATLKRDGLLERLDFRQASNGCRFLSPSVQALSDIMKRMYADFSSVDNALLRMCRSNDGEDALSEQHIDLEARLGFANLRNFLVLCRAVESNEIAPFEDIIHGWMRELEAIAGLGFFEGGRIPARSHT